MRRGWLRPLGWTLATGAIVGLSYCGVQSALAGPGDGTRVATAATPYLPTPATRSAASSSPAADRRPSDGPASAPASPSASATPTRSASPAPSVRPSPTAPQVTASPHASPPGTPGSPSASAAAGSVRTYRVEGGTVVLDIGASSATLVSRTPKSGWTAQTWQGDGWLRVEFTGGRRGSAVVCFWNGHPPVVRTYNG